MSRLSILLLVVLFTVQPSSADTDPPEPPSSDASFELHVRFDGQAVTFRQEGDDAWEVTSRLSLQHPGPYYVVRGGMAGDRASIPPTGFAFSVELSGNRVFLRGIRGVAWTVVSYGIVGSLPCEFVVTATGVRAAPMLAAD